MLKLEYNQFIEAFKPGYFDDKIYEEDDPIYQHLCEIERESKELHYGPKVEKHKYYLLATANRACKKKFHDTIYHTLDWGEYMTLNEDYGYNYQDSNEMG